MTDLEPSMMSQPQNQPQNLEDELRSMLVNSSNVSSPGPQLNGGPRQGSRQRQRGRGRGQNNAPTVQPNVRGGEGRGQGRGHVPPAFPHQARGRGQPAFTTPAPVPPMIQRRPYIPSNGQSIPQHALPAGAQNRPQVRPMGQNNPASRFMPFHRPQHSSLDMLNAQTTFLEHLALQVVPSARMLPEELSRKEKFRVELEKLCQELVQSADPSSSVSVRLAAFGSVSSGFATTGSDVDLALVTSKEVPDMFRMIEKQLLDRGFGAHLLAKTRVPILKLCQSPNDGLLEALRAERKLWDDMTPEERAKYDSSARNDIEAGEAAKGTNGDVRERPGPGHSQDDGARPTTKVDGASPSEDNNEKGTLPAAEGHIDTDLSSKTPAADPPTSESQLAQESKAALDSGSKSSSPKENEDDPKDNAPKARPPAQKKPWYRQKRLGPLDFPPDGVGIQCDINQANPLGLHNTQLLRCYSLCDPRVQDMIIFVKAWASRRMINSSRNGTLSSYGYVLMVLHFLVNIADPPVCPNLQLCRRTEILPNEKDPNAFCEGRDVRFWRNEMEIRNLAAKNFLTHNRQPLGMLLRNFFCYYAEHHGFVWMKSVLSLRTLGGILTKDQKGWTGAKTTMIEKNEVRNRYLFAIEDPFELDHNVARTVVHNGIVAIRDEFRRALHILQAVGRNQPNIDDLFAPCDLVQPPLEKQKEEEVTVDPVQKEMPEAEAIEPDKAGKHDDDASATKALEISEIDKKDDDASASKADGISSETGDQVDHASTAESMTTGQIEKTADEVTRDEMTKDETRDMSSADSQEQTTAS